MCVNLREMKSNRRTPLTPRRGKLALGKLLGRETEPPAYPQLTPLTSYSAANSSPDIPWRMKMITNLLQHSPTEIRAHRPNMISEESRLVSESEDVPLGGEYIYYGQGARSKVH